MKAMAIIGLIISLLATFWVAADGAVVDTRKIFMGDHGSKLILCGIFFSRPDF